MFRFFEKPVLLCIITQRGSEIQYIYMKTALFFKTANIPRTYILLKIPSFCIIPDKTGEAQINLLMTYDKAGNNALYADYKLPEPSVPLL